MDIDRTAPVVGKTQAQIAAGPQTVWDALTDFASWPAWKQEVDSVSFRGSVVPGSTFRWKAGPGTIRSRLAEVDAPRKIAWTGSTFGIKAVDVFRLESRDGGTLIREEESWRGLLPSLLRSRMRRTLLSGIERGMKELQVEAERRAARAAA